MEYIHRNEKPGTWNFEPADIFAGEQLLENADIQAAAQDVAKWTTRSMELIKKDNLQSAVTWSIHETGSISVGFRGCTATFNCKSVSISADERGQKSAFWAVQKLAVPEILKRNTWIECYNIEIRYNSILRGLVLSCNYQ